LSNAFEPGSKGSHRRQPLANALARSGNGGKIAGTSGPALPQAIKLTDAEGRSAIYVPITQDGKVVGSLAYILDPEDE
jgi:hypothetical protein